MNSKVFKLMHLLKILRTRAGREHGISGKEKKA